MIRNAATGWRAIHPRIAEYQGALGSRASWDISVLPLSSEVRDDTRPSLCPRSPDRLFLTWSGNGALVISSQRREMRALKCGEYQGRTCSGTSGGRSVPARFVRNYLGVMCPGWRAA